MSRHLVQLERRTEKQRGFSLIELLIVVAVILIIAAIALPNFLRSRMRANEAAAIQNLRNITTANVVYLTTYQIGFSDSLVKLAGNTSAPDSNAAMLIDSVLGSGIKSGYSYTYTVTATAGPQVSAYSVTAEPSTVGATGDRYFFVDQTAIIRQSTTGVATATDSPI